MSLHYYHFYFWFLRHKRYIIGDWIELLNESVPQLQINRLANNKIVKINYLSSILLSIYLSLKQSEDVFTKWRTSGVWDIAIGIVRRRRIGNLCQGKEISTTSPLIRTVRAEQRANETLMVYIRIHSSNLCICYIIFTFGIRFFFFCIRFNF